MIGTASTPEIIWVITAVAATAFSLRGLVIALHDQWILHRSGRNGLFAQTAESEVRREWMRLAKLCIILALGADVALREGAAVEWRAYANSALAAICWLDEIGDWIDRKRMEVLITRREAQEAKHDAVPS